MENFSWVETHKGIVEYLKDKENQQVELIQLLKDVGVDGFRDQDVNGEIELTEIDPFTFFSYIYKYGPEKRLKILQKIAKKLNLNVPNDEIGITSSNAQKLRLFPDKKERTKNEISRLWIFFKKVMNETVSDVDFADILTINGIGKAKLTENLFYINPTFYLPINGPVKPYLKEVLKIDPDFTSFSEYKNILSKVKEKTTKYFHEVSYDSWFWNSNFNKINYWIFQGNTSVYNIVDSLNDGMLKSWKVTAHFNKIKIGDKVIIWITGKNQGCYALAEVDSDIYEALNNEEELKYYFNEPSNELSKRVNIKIEFNLTDSPILKSEIENNKALTNLKIGNQGTNFMANEEEYNALIGIINSRKTPQTQPISFPLNQILYGPPGTGKTYNSILIAAQIIENKTITNYSETLKIFNENLGNRIEFITFHQNYSYEDFIQGLRPDVEYDGDLKFQKKDGIFMKIAINALFEYYKVFAKNKRLQSKLDQNLDLNEVYLSFYKHLKNNPNAIYKTITGSELTISDFTDRNCLRFSHQNSSILHTVSGDRLIKLYEIFPELNLIKSVHKDIIEAIGGCNSSVFWVALKEFISFVKLVKEQRKNRAEEDLDENIYDDLDVKEKKDYLKNINDLNSISTESVPNYVIIIDEINRANISRVFGELITLIEPDKRSHGEIPLRTTLPSGDSFIVPSNLYILGTMNTADKSIALLDIALRRRFEFVPMYPQYEINEKLINDSTLLKTINESIYKKKKSHDFEIGHAYFMGSIYNQKEVFNKKIIPLLLEYFMNDEKSVCEILKTAGLNVNEGWPLSIG